MKITVHDGAGVVGGNKILLQDSGTSIFLDFGINYAQKGLYFEDFLQPRSAKGLLDLLETGIIPPLKGLYRSELEPEGLWKRFQHNTIGEIDGVLLSHAHMDHSGHISLLREDIPIFMRLPTAVIAKAIQDSARPGFEGQVCYISSRIMEGGVSKSVSKAPYVGRHLRIIKEEIAASSMTLKKVEEFFQRIPTKSKGLETQAIKFANKIGGLPVRAFTVDHSIFGATAYAIETSSGWIVYTGDLRRHGKMGEFTEKFAQEVSKLKPRVLIMEGTNTAFTEHITEDAVGERCMDVVKKGQGLVVADFGPRNLERLLIFFRIAKESGRRLVVTAKDAYIMGSLAPIVKDLKDAIEGEGLLIYQEERAKNEGWEEEVYSVYEDRLISYENIYNDPSSYILCFSFWDFNELIDIQPKEGIYIYSTSEAFDEEQRIDLIRWKQWLDHFNLKAFGFPDTETGKVREEEKGFHASGHMNGKDILWLNETINPEVVIPVHTRNPGFFQENIKGKKVILPPKGVPINF